MGSIYSLDTDKNLLLYTSSHNICLRSSLGENLTRPVILCHDYASDLSDVIYQGTIYYCYQNTNQDICVKNITEPDILYQKSSQDTPDCFHPRLAVLDNSLLLFYFVKNPVHDTYVLKCRFPLALDQKLSIDEVYPTLPSFQLLSLKQQVLLVLGQEASLQLLSLDSKHTLLALETRENLLQQLQQDTKEQLLALSSQHQTELSQVVSGFQEDMKKKDALIESIKGQYTELMETASKYRAEALKWREKYLERST